MQELIFHRSLLPATERFADKAGFIDADLTLTYAEHTGRVCQLTNALGSELGVSRDDRFAVLALNSQRYLELWHAAFLGGGVINPLNLRLAPQELTHILTDSATKVCFVDQFFAPLVDAVRAETAVEQVVLIGGGDVPHDLGYEELLAAGSTATPSEPDEDDPVVLDVHRRNHGAPEGCGARPTRADAQPLPRDHGVELRQQLRVSAPDADVPRGVDGRHPRRAFGRRHVDLRPRVRTRRGHAGHRTARRDDDRDGAHDDRADDDAPGVSRRPVGIA